MLLEPSFSAITRNVPLNIEDNLEGLLPDKQLPFLLQLLLSLAYISGEFAIILQPAPVGLWRRIAVATSSFLLAFRLMMKKVRLVEIMAPVAFLVLVGCTRASHRDCVEQRLLRVMRFLAAIVVLLFGASICRELLLRHGGQVDLGFICHLVYLVRFIEEHLVGLLVGCGRLFCEGLPERRLGELEHTWRVLIVTIDHNFFQTFHWAYHMIC